ncbi:hypothetical protein ANAPH2_01307 [Anaplasma phagocytophilum]|nr:hypothetical protein ANAPH2_00917 [Anaplasma phagocytophilum]SCV65570.1 hypothetical protein ANAPH2_01307 [Anaplasma phagocytophilum]
MMLLLGRLITLLLLLLRLLGRTLLNLPMLLLEFLTLILMRRFVRRSRVEVTAARILESMPRKRTRTAVTEIAWPYVEEKEALVEVVMPR